MSFSERRQAYEAVEEGYHAWVEGLPHVFSTGDGGARCVAVEDLKFLRDDLRILAHVLMRGGEGALAARLDREFDGLLRSADALVRFAASRHFDPATWFHGDEEAQRRLVVVDLPPAAMIARARKTASGPLTDGWTRGSLRRHAAFWLAYNVRCRKGAPGEADQAIQQMLGALMVRSEEKWKIQRWAIRRAYGTNALRYNDLARRIGARKLSGIDEFYEEMQLAETAPPPAAINAGDPTSPILIPQSWYTAKSVASLLGYARGHISRLVGDGTLRGEKISGIVYIDPNTVHAHPRYRTIPLPATGPSASRDRELEYECIGCSNVVTSSSGKPGRCPKCNGRGLVLSRRPRHT